MSTLRAAANFSTTVIDTFLEPFSILGMYDLSKSAANASDSCEIPLSNRSRLRFLPNFTLMSILQKSNNVDSRTMDYCQHAISSIKYFHREDLNTEG